MHLKNKKFHLITLGCRVNLFESNWLVSKLIFNGAKQVDNISSADICIINTCSVTNAADAKTKNFLNRIQRQKNLKLSIVMGCFSQINKTFFLKNNFDIVIGNKYKTELIDLIKNFSGKKIIKIEDLSLENKFELFPCEATINSTRAYLKIQDGCNYKCSYCIIPSARGKQRSLDPKKILETINKLNQFGIKEIVLTGVNTAGYGENSSYKFENLLKDINLLPGDFRLRISSLEPFQISSNIINLITSNPQRWCQHLHICLQSANDKVLKQMNRKYSTKKFIELCRTILSKNKFFSLTTDFIVGFPSESELLFVDGYKNLQKIPFANMHIFPYSDRNGTIASKLPKLYSSIEKTNRLKIIRDWNNQAQTKYLKQFLNKSVNVLFEKSHDKKYQHGHSEYFFEVYVSTKRKLTNELFQVKITKIIKNKVYGCLLKSDSLKNKRALEPR